MNWKFTLGLAVAAAAAGAVYLFYSPATTELSPEQNSLLQSFPKDRLNRIVLSKRGENETVLERNLLDPSAGWRVVKPIDRPADPAVLQQMVWGIDRFQRNPSFEPGRPETDPSITGLDEPRLQVTFEAEGRREVVKFGKAPQTNPGAVFFRREGDPKVYLALTDTYATYQKHVNDIRSKTLVRYEPFRAVRMEVEHWFKVARAKDNIVTEYEKTTFERFETGPDRGWFITSPWRERADDMKVARLIADLPTLPIENFQPLGDPRALGLEEPELKVAVTLFGGTGPVRVHFGGLDPTKKKRYVTAVGSGEVALIDALKYDDLPRQRKHFRTDAIFTQGKEKLSTITVEPLGAPRLVLERRETRKDKGEEALVTSTWAVKEPPDLPTEKDMVDGFVGQVMLEKVVDFLGAQPDLKLFDLDPPRVRLSLKEKEGAASVYLLGQKGDTAYLKRAERDEIYQVRLDFLKILRKTELNFRKLEVFNVDPAKIREFRFEFMGSGLERVYYKMRLDEKDKKWKFADVFVKEKPDEGRVNAILKAINYIQAEWYVSREPEDAAKYKLLDRQAPATLTIAMEDGQAVLYLTDDLTGGGRIYYGRFEGNPVIFQVQARTVDLLRAVPVEKPKPEERPEKK